MRLFVALDIEPGIRRRIGEFRNQMREFAPDVRWVGPETFHVTLQFLGETEKLDQIRGALQQVEGAAVPLVRHEFPGPKQDAVCALNRSKA